MKAIAFGFLLVFCVDIPGNPDRCFSTGEKAAAYCDTMQACRDLYVRAGKYDSRKNGGQR